MSRIHGPHKILSLVALFALSIVGCGGGSGGGGSNTPPPPPPPPPPAEPTVSVTAPAAPVNRTIALTAEVEAPAGITSVEFLVDGTVIGTATEDPFSVNWDTSTVADGDHAITARVTDADEQVVTSEEATFTVTNNPVIPVTLSNAGVFPPVDSDATGEGEVTVNLVTGAVSGGVTIEGLTATLAHIHRGFAGVNGPVIVDFEQDPADPARWNAVADGVLSAEDVDALLAGGLYVNVHSAAFPAGEIRGQLQPDNITVVFSAMSNDQVVPAAPDPASGTIATTVDSNASTATIHAFTSAIVEPTSAHVHIAAEGENAADVLLELAQDAGDPNHWSSELQEVSAADLEQFAANAWYVDVHSTGLPDGAARGQIVPNPEPPVTAATLTQLQDTIFSPLCSGCHSGVGAALPGVMNLSNADATFTSLVGVPSIEQPALLRVDPNASGNSYLIHKLEGAATIDGERMPLGGAPLGQATIDQVKAWIDAGAQNN